MVSLALYTPSILPEEALPGRNDLRDSALWHPNVPAPTLCLNEDSFPQSDSYTSGYKPLFWCHFGGPGGRYLPHLTRILATWGFDGIQHFDFFFDTEVPAEHRSFGRMRARRDDDLRTTFDFLIDGPGGERIQSIELGHFYPGWDLVRTLSGTIRNGTTLWCEVCLYPTIRGSFALFTHVHFPFPSCAQTAGDHAASATNWHPATRRHQPSSENGLLLLRDLRLLVSMPPRYAELIYPELP